MTDYTSKIAGNYPGGYRLSVILDEGAATVSAAAMVQTGTYEKIATWATPLVEGDIVALSNDAANMYDETGGLAVFERPVAAESPVIVGQIVSAPELVTMPLSTATSDTLVKRLAAGYYRIAEVEIWGGVTKVTKANITGASQAILPGQTALTKIDVSDGVGGTGLNLLAVASGGATGIVPLTAVASDTDQSTVLVALTAGTYVTVA